MERHFPHQSRSTDSSQMGFTLLELMVATVILILLLTMLITIVSHTANIAAQVDAQKARQQAARLAMEIITRDLEAAAFPLIPSSTNSLQFLVNPGISGIPRNRDAAFWQAVVPGDTSASDLSEVGYFVAWTTNAGAPTGELRRLRVPPGAPDSIFQDPANWLTAQKLTNYAPGSSGTGSNALKGLITQNVLALWITLYDQTNGVICPTNALDSYDSRATSVRPASAEVALVIIDPRTAKRLTSAAEITNSYKTYSTPEAFVASFTNKGISAGIQVFKERVEIHAAEVTP